jgi:YHS domain-containing protein
MKSSWFLGLVAFFATFASVSIALEDKVDVSKLKCLMNPDSAAKEDKTSDWKDGKVYFCCGNCLKKFDANKKDFAAKANHQLIASKQVEQKACPFSGGAVNKDTAIEFKGASIAFCCNNCKGKAEKMSDDDKVKDLFGEDAYAKAKFAKVEKKK